MSFSVNLFGVPIWNTEDLLLDKYSTDISVAYSATKKLSKNATYAFKLVRNNDLAEQNIGFVNNKVDISSALSFLNNNTGTVKILYNQANNTDHLVQEENSKQPVFTLNGLIFDGINDLLLTNSPIRNIPFSVISKQTVLSFHADVGLNNIFNSYDGDDFLFRLDSNTTAQGYAASYFSVGYPIIIGQSFISSFYLDLTGNYIYKNSSLIETNNTTLGGHHGFIIGARSGDIRFSNILFETLIIYNSNQNNNRLAIESYL